MNAAHPADDRLIDYALGELEAPARKDIETHLRDCDTCRSMAVALAGAIESVRQAECPEPPAHILVDLLDAQATARARRYSRLSWFSWFSKPAGAMAAAVVLAGIFAGGFLAGRQTSPVPGSLASSPDTLGAIHYPLPEPPDIPFQTALGPASD